MFRMTDDGSVLSSDDRVIFFSCSRFIAVSWAARLPTRCCDTAGGGPTQARFWLEGGIRHCAKSPDPFADDASAPNPHFFHRNKSRV